MENQELNYTSFEFVDEVRNYVNGVLTASLTAENIYEPEKQQRTTELLNKIYENPELGKQIAERIVAHGIKYSATYAYDAYSKNRREIFMRYLYAFLNQSQIANLAVYFDRQIEAEKAQEETQKRSR